MANGDNGNGKLTWRWLGGVLLFIVFATVGMIMAETKTSIVEAQKKAEEFYKTNQVKIECVQREKLDKDQYYRDISEIKDAVKEINHKLDRMK